MATSVKYNSFLKNQMNGGSGTAAKVVDFDTDTIKAMLVTSSYTPSASTHTTKADITNEVTGGGYTTGGITLASVTLTESGGTVTFDAADITWAASGTGFTTARYLILYKSTGTDNTSALILYYDLGTNRTNLDADYTVQWDAAGILSWS